MKRLITCALVLLVAGVALAQNAPMFSAVEVVVKPSNNPAYREAVKKLKAACESSKANSTWLTFITDENHYVYTAPIKSLGDLEKDFFADVKSKIGAETFAALWPEIDKYTESSRQFVLRELTEASYMTPIPEDQTARTYMFWQPAAGKHQEAKALIKEWTDIYKAKNIPLGITAYEIAFGGDGGFIIQAWGKDILDIETKIAKRNELLGADLGRLWQKTMAITDKVWFQTGTRSNALSYVSAPK